MEQEQAEAQKRSLKFVHVKPRQGKQCVLELTTLKVSGWVSAGQSFAQTQFPNLQIDLFLSQIWLCSFL